VLAVHRGSSGAAIARRTILAGLRARHAPREVTPMSDLLSIRCPECGAVNRVMREKVARGLAASCGRCHQRLPYGEPVEVTDDSFAADVLGAELPVLVDAWAPWCGPCRAVAPIVADLAADFAGRVRVAKLDVDMNPRTAARYDLRSIPTLLVFRGGREVDRLVGLRPKAEIAQRLESALDAR
jgi:thioredoxin 2